MFIVKVLDKALAGPPAVDALNLATCVYKLRKTMQRTYCHNFLKYNFKGVDKLKGNYTINLKIVPSPI